MKTAEETKAFRDGWIAKHKLLTDIVKDLIPLAEDRRLTLLYQYSPGASDREYITREASRIESIIERAHQATERVDNSHGKIDLKAEAVRSRQLMNEILERAVPNYIFTRDTMWWLIQGELPTMPEGSVLAHKNEYDQAISDLKANAIKVVEWDVIVGGVPSKTFDKTPNDIYKWPGRVEIKEIETVEDGGGCYVAGVKKVAKLLYP
jgi:hypothetical protein